MEKGGKKKQQRNEEKSTWKKRGPLQDLNGLPTSKPTSKKRSNPSSAAAAAAAVSIETPKGCLRFSLSSNSCSSSSSSSFSRTYLEKKPKTFSKISDNESKKSSADASKAVPRSKENEIPRKQFLQKSKKNQPLCANRRQSSKTNTRLIFENSQRSKLSSVRNNPLNKSKKGHEEIQLKVKSSQEPPSELRGVANGSSSNSAAENCTPVREVSGACGLDSLSFREIKPVIEDSVNDTANGDSATAVKTPPVEASLSPEIQYQSHSKMLVLKSAATPVCYGAGHLVSGVTDNRKCRRRGSLKGGFEKVNLFDDERNDGDVNNGLQDSPIPLLAEASVRWLSPGNEGREDPGSDSTRRLGQRKMMCVNGSGTLDLSSSQSRVCGNSSVLLCPGSSYSGNDSICNVECKVRSTNLILSNRKATEFKGILEPLNTIDETTSSVATHSCNGISSRERKTFSPNPTGDNSALSVGSLSSGNVIQTPNSNSISDASVKSRSDVHCSYFIQSELDSIAETLNGVDLSPKSEMSKWDASGLAWHFDSMPSVPYSADVTKFQKNVDCVSSWVSDSTLDNMALSQMKISWQDDLAFENVQTDEFDCCCILDEQINSDECPGEQVRFFPPSESNEGKESYLSSDNGQRAYKGAKSGENEEDDSVIDMDISPILSKYEPCISTKGKEKLLTHGTNICAESICTDAGGLIASGDSDWTCCHEHHLY